MSSRLKDCSGKSFDNASAIRCTESNNSPDDRDVRAGRYVDQIVLNEMRCTHVSSKHS